MNKAILVVDDDQKFAELLKFHLEKKGYAVPCVLRGALAAEAVRQNEPGLVLLDIRLPDKSGVEVLKELCQSFPGLNVIMVSAHADVKVAVDCMKLGAYDFIEKPIAFPELDAKVNHVFRQFSLEEEVLLLRKELGEKYKYKRLIGKSPEMLKIFQAIEIAAGSDVSVLIEGESGTGKELVARAIHFNSPRKEGPFIPVNCGAIPENLLESELFGHEKGSFTGAISRKIGKFEQAGTGTIFLDEIADLSGVLQVKLLRALQEREIERVGGSAPIQVQARFIVATNQDLKKMVTEGKFREDLYFRINVFPIPMPPLRERSVDIPELLRYFVKKYRGARRGVSFDDSALKRLLEYRWPGNVRELENVVERILLVKGEGEVLTGSDIQSLGLLVNPSLSAGIDKEKVLGDAERALFDTVLKESGGNVSKACRLLKISRDTFYRKMKKYSASKSVSS